MADSMGLLSTDDQARIERWLENRDADGPCPTCGYPDYSINPYVMNIRSEGNTYFPAVLIHCVQCTSTRFFSAKLIGVAKEDEDGA